MSQTKIAARYAKALYDLSKENNSVEPVVSDMRTLQQLVLENPEIIAFLNSPLYSKVAKIEKLSALFSKFHKSSLDLFRLMATKNREELLPLVASEFIGIYGAENGITEAEVSSAVELEEKSLDEIRRYIIKRTGAKTVNFNVKIEPSLIGGMKIMFDGQLYDSSISSQINNMKKELKLA